MTPYGLQKTLTEIGNDTGEAIQKSVNTNANKGKIQGSTHGNRKTEMRQDKTGSYGEKRKPGDAIK